MKNNIPKITFSTKTAYLAGLIIGDGNLNGSSKSKRDLSKDYRIKIDISDKEYLLLIEKMIKSIINTKSSPKKPVQRGNRKERLYLQIRNKGLYRFLNEEMEIPAGKKSDIVIVPKKVLNSNRDIKKNFLSGYFDADGGFRGKSLGFTK